MCGIIASIGTPKHPELTHALMSSLLKKTEVRGDDATGFWACEQGPEGAIYFSKEPIRATEFLEKNKLWADWKGKNIDLMIAHCRKRTYANGSETINKNNHPFVSKDYLTALVHNGNVPEFTVLKNNYEIESTCDSEILLRMLESGHTYDEEYLRKELASLRVDAERSIADLNNNEEIPHWSPRLLGLRDIFAQVNYGAMAVCIGERWDDGTHALWMFRDKERPLNVIDMRPELGQIFVVSTPKIWREGVEACPEVLKVTKEDHKIIEFPEMFVWLLTLDLEGKIAAHKWKINKKPKHDTTWEKERPPRVGERKLREKPKILTNLGDDYEPIKPAVNNGDKAFEKKNYNGQSNLPITYNPRVPSFNATTFDRQDYRKQDNLPSYGPFPHLGGCQFQTALSKNSGLFSKETFSDILQFPNDQLTPEQFATLESIGGLQVTEQIVLDDDATDAVSDVDLESLAEAEKELFVREDDYGPLEDDPHYDEEDEKKLNKQLISSRPRKTPRGFQRHHAIGSIEMRDLSNKIDEIKRQLSDMETSLTNLATDDMVGTKEFNEVMDTLNEVQIQLESQNHIIDSYQRHAG